MFYNHQEYQLSTKKQNINTNQIEKYMLQKEYVNQEMQVLKYIVPFVDFFVKFLLVE